MGAHKSDQREIGKRIGIVVRARREKMELTQEDLAFESDHHRNYIGFLERGERCPNVATLERIAEALGTRVSDILREAGY